MAEREEFEADILTLTDEEGVEKNFAVIGDMELDGNNYLALVPEDEEGDEFVILKLAIDEEGHEMLVTIDDDDEFDKVADAFEDELMEECDHDGCDCGCEDCKK